MIVFAEFKLKRASSVRTGNKCLFLITRKPVHFFRFVMELGLIKTEFRSNLGSFNELLKKLIKMPDILKEASTQWQSTTDQGKVTTCSPGFRTRLQEISRIFVTTLFGKTIRSKHSKTCKSC
jgi:hypothetical protein